ncbi:MAG TPA: hypothetical protein VJ865_08195, partial [Gemmatimonadaceae bacterium]|nr:hypothetical protein [Gemmatimonadaceae bacterium]
MIDLLSWEEASLPILTSEALRAGRTLVDRAVLPTANGSSRTSLAAAWTWPSTDTVVLTGELVANVVGVSFLPTLPPGRRARLDSLLAALDLTADPDATQLAEWMETVFKVSAQRREPIAWWDAAYADLAQVFARDVETLRGRTMLLTDTWELRSFASANRGSDQSPNRAATPFFPPVKQRIDDEDDVDPDADLNLPRSLARRIFYVHRDLSWYDNRQQTPARRYLQNNGLVRRFDSRSILDHIRTVLTGSRKVAPTTARDALVLTFNLTRGNSASRTDLSTLGLLVPSSLGSWIPAETALFSESWPGTNGDDLSTIASTPNERSPELHALSERLLASPSDIAGKSSELDKWTQFLRDIGVQDVLQLHSLNDSRRIDGGQLVADRLASVDTLPGAVRAAWLPELPKSSAARFPQTPYKAETPLYWLPGQADWAQLTDRVKRSLTRQILLGLSGAWGRSSLETVWAKDRPYDPDQLEIPTPFRAFLTTAPWVPVQRPTQSAPDFRAPGDSCWMYISGGDGADDGPPRFAPLVAKWFRDLVNANAQCLEVLRTLGIAVWGADRDSGRLVNYLGRLAANGQIPDVHMHQFRSVYSAAWTACGHAGINPFGDGLPAHVVVDVGGQPTSLSLDPQEGNETSPEIVVAAIGGDRSLLRLLNDFQRNVLTIDGNSNEVVALLSQSIGDRAIDATEITPTVFVDGSSFDANAEPHAVSLSLVELVPQLPVLIGTLLDYRRSAFDRSGQRAFDDTLDVLRRIRLIYGSRVEVRIGDETRPIPNRLHGVLPMPHGETPTLVVEKPDKALDWHLLETAAEPLLYLLGRPHLTDAFRLATLRLQARNSPLHDLDDSDLAAACGVSEGEVRGTTRRVDTAITPLLMRLYPVLAHYLGAETSA